jgi:hypothetical protein
LGGAWSTYWYNDLLYESEIQVGLNVFRFRGRELRDARRLPHLNPQTQEFSFGARDGDEDDDTDDDTDDNGGGGGGGDDDTDTDSDD